VKRLALGLLLPFLLGACGEGLTEIPEPELRCKSGMRFEGGHGCVFAVRPPTLEEENAPRVAEAARHLEAGTRLYGEGKSEEALAQAKAAEAIHSTPAGLRLVALCHDSLGHAKEAVAAYRKFIARAPVNMAGEIEDAKLRIDALSESEGERE